MCDTEHTINSVASGGVFADANLCTVPASCWKGLLLYVCDRVSTENTFNVSGFHSSSYY
jgi:hypothetical protein